MGWGLQNVGLPRRSGRVKILDDPEELLANALAGHPDWDAIWRVVRDPLRWAVRSVLRGRCYGGCNEDDVVQAAFEELMNKGFEGAPSLTARAWIIGWRRAQDLLRQRNPEPRAEPCRFVAVDIDDEVVLAEMLRERAERFRRALVALAQLPDKQRYAVEQTVLKGRSRTAVARELGVSHQAVSKLRIKGIGRLRALLAQDSPPWEEETG